MALDAPVAHILLALEGKAEFLQLTVPHLAPAPEAAGGRKRILTEAEMTPAQYAMVLKARLEDMDIHTPKTE